MPLSWSWRQEKKTSVDSGFCEKRGDLCSRAAALTVRKELT